MKPEKDRNLASITAKLTDESPQVRRETAQSLGEKRDEEAIPALVFALGDKNRGCQEAAMEALVQIGGPKAVKHLLPLISNKNVHIRTAAIEVLESIGRDAAGLIVKLLKDREASVRIVAADILGKLRVQEALTPLLKLLNDKDSNVRCATMTALGQIGGAAVAKKIRPVLNDPEEWVRFSGIETLGWLGNRDAVPWLVEKLNDSSEVTVCGAITALGRLGGVDAVPALLQLLDASGVVMRSHIVHSLVTIAETAESDLYETYDFGRYESYFIEALEHSSPEIRNSAVKALQRIGTAKAVLPLLHLVGIAQDDEDRVARIEETLCSIGAGDELVRYMRSLTGPLEKEAEFSVQVAGRVLSYLNPADAAPALLDFIHLQGRSEPVRRVIVETLGRLGDPRAVPSLIEMLQDTNGHVRRDVVEALGHLGDENAVLPLFVTLDREVYEDVREAILQSLLEIGGEKVKEKFREFIFYPDTKIKKLAVRALGMIGDQEACDHLIANLGHEDHEIRMRVIESLGQLECEKMVDPVMHCLSDEHEKVRLAAIDMLLKMPSPKVIQSLVASMYDVSSWVAFRAAEALGQIGDPEAVEPMIERLEETEDISMKIALIRSLQQIGDPRAASVLSTMQKDTNPDIRDLFTQQVD